MDYEQKAKAYDEALERARMILCNLPYGSASINDIETIFPKLRENEDERIRKAIINIFATHKDYEIFFGVSVEDIIAYLEKQKHSLNFDAISSWLRDHASRYVNSEYNEFHHCVEYDGTIDVERLIDDLKVVVDSGAFDEKKEQKSIEDVVKDITKNKETAIGFLKSAGIMDDNGELAEMYRPEQNPAEWSEEDERNFYWISTTIQERHLTPEYTKQVHKILTWLKSLRPHPRWKPSDEQMRVFFKANPVNLMPEELGVYHSLCNDLQKHYGL